ncbi:MAG: tRNA (adenosine(37)-N6)-threonylcarbamoyltransferase complex dimerization subunit type 1 TsaB [Candidatus Acetothermia bacterium]
MLTLGFDTATEIGTVGLADGDQLLGEYTFKATESQSERLLSSIDLLLDKTGFGVSEVEKVAVSRGPGSFTGLRIGISTAKGLAAGLDAPLVGVPLTSCYYSRVDYYPGPVITLIKDRRDLVYVAGYDHDGEKVQEEESISIEKVTEGLIPRMVDSSRPVLVVGDGTPEHSEVLREAENTRLATGVNNYPSGLQIAFLGASAESGENELAVLEPLYAQRPIAEVNWKKQQAGGGTN